MSHNYPPNTLQMSAAVERMHDAFWNCVRAPALPSPQKTDASGKRASAGIGEGETLRRVDVVIHECGISVACDVVESAAHRPIRSQKSEALLQMRVQTKVRGETPRSRCFHKELLRIHDTESESAASFHGIRRIHSIKDCQFKKGQQSPGEHAVGNVPGIRARGLRAQ